MVVDVARFSAGKSGLFLFLTIRTSKKTLGLDLAKKISRYFKAQGRIVGSLINSLI